MRIFLLVALAVVVLTVALLEFRGHYASLLRVCYSTLTTYSWFLDGWSSWIFSPPQTLNLLCRTDAWNDASADCFQGPRILLPGSQDSTFEERSPRALSVDAGV